MHEYYEECNENSNANQERQAKYDPSLYYYNQSTFFATEKINLPRGKVVNDDSLNSSPSHGFR